MMEQAKTEHITSEPGWHLTRRDNIIEEISLKKKAKDTGEYYKMKSAIPYKKKSSAKKLI